MYFCNAGERERPSNPPGTSFHTSLFALVEPLASCLVVSKVSHALSVHIV